MKKNKIELFNYFLGLSEPQHWMMGSNERFTIVGILELLRPPLAIELGFAEGGCTEYLSKYSKKVYTIDTDQNVLKVSELFDNVIPLNMTTEKAFQIFSQKKMKFDFCVIDADHTTEGAFRDLRGAMKIADIIIMHDTSNPQCRAGYKLAMQGKDVYFDLDLLEGHIQTDGLWGGLGIVMNIKSGLIQNRLTKKFSTYDLLIKEFEAKAKTHKIKKNLEKNKYLIKTLIKKIINIVLG